MTNKFTITKNQDFGLHAADPGEGREFLQQVAEEVAAAPAFENLVHRLKGHSFPTRRLKSMV